MSTVKNKAHYQEFIYEFSENGGDVGAINLGSLPLGAIVVASYGDVEKAIASTGSATVAIGSTSASGGWMTDTAKASLTKDVVIGGAKAAAVACAATGTADVIMTISTAPLTSGKIVAGFNYNLPGSKE